MSSIIGFSQLTVSPKMGVTGLYGRTPNFYGIKSLPQLHIGAEFQYSNYYGGIFVQDLNISAGYGGGFFPDSTRNTKRQSVELYGQVYGLHFGKLFKHYHSEYRFGLNLLYSSTYAYRYFYLYDPNTTLDRNEFISEYDQSLNGFGIAPEALMKTHVGEHFFIQTGIKFGIITYPDFNPLSFIEFSLVGGYDFFIHKQK